MDGEKVLDYVLGHQGFVFAWIGAVVSFSLLMLTLFARVSGRFISEDAPLLEIAVWTRSISATLPLARAIVLAVSTTAPWKLGLVGGLLVIVVTVCAGVYGRTTPVPKTTFLDTSSLALDMSKKNLIIFIHGWRGSSGGTWLHFPDLVNKDSRFSDTHVIAVDYPIYIARRNLTIGETASWVLDNLERNGVAHYSRIAIIGHSIGGLVSRKMVLSHRSSLHGLRLLVEVATPHLGTERYAQLADTLGIDVPGNDVVMEVKRDSDWLRELSNSWNDLEMRVPTRCFTSPNDELVPISSAIFQCDRYFFLPGYGHTEMVKPENASDNRYSEPMAAVNDFLHPDPALNTEIARPHKTEMQKDRTQ